MKHNRILRETDSELRSTAWWFSGTSRLDFPRSAQTFAATVGFIGSEELYRSIRPECPVHLLTRANWRVALEAGLVDLVLIEPCLREVTDDWQESIFDGNAVSAEFRDLLGTAREAGIPSVCWITSDVAYRDLHTPFASLVDVCSCADYAFAEHLTGTGIEAFHLPQTIQPSIHNPFLDLADRDHRFPDVLFLGWTSVLADQGLADALLPLVPMGLGIAEPKGRVRRFRMTSTPGLTDAIFGSVGLRDRLLLLKGSKILVQTADDLVPRRIAEQAALEAAACQCVVLHLGPLDPRDARSRFARSFETWSDLRAFVAELQSDRVFLLRLAQLSWRAAQESYPIAASLAAIFAACGIQSELPVPRASVVTPTIRPELLEKVLTQFRSQTWGNKELVVVANTNDPSAWPAHLIDTASAEQIVFLPRDNWAGTALNAGARRTSGGYVFRMDDDDYYGENYLKDMMLHARSTGADVLSKQAEFLYSTGHEAVFRRLRRSSRNIPATVFSSGDFSYPLTPMGGFTMTMKREVALAQAYPDHAFGSADYSFLATAREANNLRMAITDIFNAIVERRSDVSTHTWKMAADWNDPALFEKTSASIDDFIV